MYNIYMCVYIYIYTRTHIFSPTHPLSGSLKASVESTSPQAFWHQGPVLRKAVFPQTGVGKCFRDGSHRSTRPSPLAWGLSCCENLKLPRL